VRGDHSANTSALYWLWFLPGRWLGWRGLGPEALCRVQILEFGFVFVTGIDQFLLDARDPAARDPNLVPGYWQKIIVI